MAEQAQTPEDVKDRRAVLLVPGLAVVEKGQRRDRFVANLETAERFQVRKGEEITVTGETGVRILSDTATSDDAPKPADIDVFEAYWADMAPDVPAMGPIDKMLYGLRLIAYWVLSIGMWRALGTGNKYLSFGLIFSGLLLILWYLSVSLLVVSLVLQGDKDTLEFFREWYLGWLVDVIKLFGPEVQSWQFWGFLAIVLPMFGIDERVRIASFTKDYLANLPDDTGVGLRDRVRKRVAASIRNLQQAGYGEIVVVSHSFGTVIATDILADWPSKEDFERRLGLLTMGSLVTALSHRSEWLLGQAEKLAQTNRPQRWHDCHSQSDFLCQPYPGHASADETVSETSHALNFEASLVDRLLGKPHMSYYQSPVPHDLVLDPDFRLDGNLTL